MEQIKYIILLGDGMADDPQPEHGNKTPLELAATPNMDRVAKRGTLGLVRTIPRGMEPGSDVANMAILGYDPDKYYTGRAAIEAAAMDIQLKQGQVALRCNLVTFGQDQSSPVMKDYSAGHISSEESKQIIETLQQELGSDTIQFYPGVSFRNLLTIESFEEQVELFPPHDHLGKPVSEIEPQGPGAQTIQRFQKESQRILKDHPINQARREQGKSEATSIWLWGLGTAPSMPSFKQSFGLDAAVITGVDLIRGLGKLLEFDIIEVPGATGYVDTNYEGKASAAIQALDKSDLVFLHVEAPDESAHEGNLELKIKAIEDFDKRIVGPVLDGLGKFKAWRAMVLPDHETPTKERCHRDGPVPFAVVDNDQWGSQDNSDACFTEAKAASMKVIVEPGHDLITSYLVKPARGLRVMK